jgi:SAM-dependent methyltransferase
LERRAVRHLWPVLRPPRRILDVGCATGDLLAAIRARGNLAVTGVEPSEDAARSARARGLDVRTGFLEDAEFPDGAFDTLVASHTLEHVPDPLAFLREARRVLSSRGVLLLWLPNADSVEARFFGRYWIGYDAPRHLTDFTPATLRRSLVAADFEIRSIKHEAIGLEWAWALRLWMRERWPVSETVLRRLHPLLIMLASPLAASSALLAYSGRIRVVAMVRRT